MKIKLILLGNSFRNFGPVHNSDFFKVFST